jgi:uncharacterized protein (DUF2235 family)
MNQVRIYLINTFTQRLQRVDTSQINQLCTPQYDQGELLFIHRKVIQRYLMAIMLLILCGCVSIEGQGQKINNIKTLANINSVDESVNRKILIFMDGTGNNDNTNTSNTNLLQLYNLSLQKKDGAKIIPLYVRGVGSQWYNRISGGVTGLGLNKNIMSAYKFIVENYKEGDEIFIFGFSRGAYSSRSLNGLIEFANIIDLNEVDKNELNSLVRSLFKSYHVNNDGKFGFDDRLRKGIADKFGHLMVKSKVYVTAIGVFDTVPAIGLRNDDFPDNHRTDLYAKKGFHALSLDEQRYAFKLLRFDESRLSKNQYLKEVWFTGAHADVGGGYADDDGLESVSREWMIESFREFDIFPKDNPRTNCKIDGNCYSGYLHDNFLRSKFFNKMGISRRSPNFEDFVHGSVVCRVNRPTPLINPNKGREPAGKYTPFNLKAPINQFYKLIPYACN